MRKIGKMIIFGGGPFAQIAYEYFTHDSLWEIVAFTVEKEFIKQKLLFGCPIVPFEEVEKMYSPVDFRMLIAVGYGQKNKLKEKIFKQATCKGYTLTSYISSRAFVWHNVECGIGCFVFESNVIQPFVKIGDNNTFWSGNHIGHHSVIGSHNFFSSHVVLSGSCVVGDRCFFGVNSTIADSLKIGNDVVVGAGANVTEDLEIGGVYIGNPARKMKENG